MEEKDIPMERSRYFFDWFHYYMTPEYAQKGIDKLPEAINKKPKFP